jgi:hypothetical protein
MKPDIVVCHVCFGTTAGEAGCFVVRAHSQDATVTEVVMCKSCAESFIDLVKKEFPRTPIERKS